MQLTPPRFCGAITRKGRRCRVRLLKPGIRRCTTHAVTYEEHSRRARDGHPRRGNA